MDMEEEINLKQHFDFRRFTKRVPKLARAAASLSYD